MVSLEMSRGRRWERTLAAQGDELRLHEQGNARLEAEIEQLLKQASSSTRADAALGSVVARMPTNEGVRKMAKMGGESACWKRGAKAEDEQRA